jgi:hypothetical protein
VSDEESLERVLTMNFPDVSVYLNKGHHIRRLAWAGGITISKMSDGSPNLVVNSNGLDLDWEPESLDLDADDWIAEPKGFDQYKEKISIPLVKAPSIQEMYEARDIFLKGYAANYPGLDPREGLLGVDDEYRYINDAYGNRLVPIPPDQSWWQKFVAANIVPFLLFFGFVLGHWYT